MNDINVDPQKVLAVLEQHQDPYIREAVKAAYLQVAVMDLSEQKLALEATLVGMGDNGETSEQPQPEVQNDSEVKQPA